MSKPEPPDIQALPASTRTVVRIQPSPFEPAGEGPQRAGDTQSSAVDPSISLEIDLDAVPSIDDDVALLSSTASFEWQIT